MKCRERFGAGVGSCLFYQTSNGCVAGVVLVDNRRVVVKVHQLNRMNQPKLDSGEVALVCGPPPEGRARWTIPLLGWSASPVDGHVTMLDGLHHVTDRYDLAVRQSLRHGARTAGSVVERAGQLQNVRRRG